jgi:hypothetical protein
LGVGLRWTGVAAQAGWSCECVVSSLIREAVRQKANKDARQQSAAGARRPNSPRSCSSCGSARRPLPVPSLSWKPIAGSELPPIHSTNGPGNLRDPRSKTCETEAWRSRSAASGKHSGSRTIPRSRPDRESEPTAIQRLRGVRRKQAARLDWRAPKPASLPENGSSSVASIARHYGSRMDCPGTETAGCDLWPGPAATAYRALSRGMQTRRRRQRACEGCATKTSARARTSGATGRA